jgi:hypothetical protein
MKKGGKAHPRNGCNDSITECIRLYGGRDGTRNFLVVVLPPKEPPGFEEVGDEWFFLFFSSFCLLSFFFKLGGSRWGGLVK